MGCMGIFGLLPIRCAHARIGRKKGLWYLYIFPFFSYIFSIFIWSKRVGDKLQTQSDLIVYCDTLTVAYHKAFPPLHSRSSLWNWCQSFLVFFLVVDQLPSQSILQKKKLIKRSRRNKMELAFIG